jgi:hypothetical protein
MNTPVDAVKVKPRIAQGLPAGMDAELGKPIRAPDFLRCRKCGQWVEVLHFGGNLGVELRGIKAGNSGDAALAGDQVGPEGINLVTQGGNDAEAGYDYAAVSPIAGHKIKRGSLS